jgi:hypothetical protein
MQDRGAKNKKAIYIPENYYGVSEDKVRLLPCRDVI